MYVLVLAKKSALRAHLEQDERGSSRVQELLARNDPTVARMRGAHAQHEQALTELHEALVSLGCEVRLVVATALDEFRVVIDHPAQGLLPTTSVRDSVRPATARRPELVVTLGGDGTLLAASHAIGDTPVLAINSAPDYSVGFFCGGRLGSIRPTLARALEGELKAVRLQRMRVCRNGEVLSERVLNEALVCAASPAATTRYLLQHRGHVEEQKSSGLWVGPAAGSTAAQRSAGGRVLPLTSEKLQFVVREPYTPAGHSLRFPRGLVAKDHELVIHMKSADGRVFVDGPHEVHECTLGDELTFRASAQPLNLVGVSRRRGWG